MKKRFLGKLRTIWAGQFNILGWVCKNILPEEITVRKAILLAIRVAMVLYKLGSSAKYRPIANQFGVHKSTVKKFVYMFCKDMAQGPIKDLIRVPTEEEVRSHPDSRPATTCRMWRASLMAHTSLCCPFQMGTKTLSIAKASRPMCSRQLSTTNFGKHSFALFSLYFLSII